MFIPDSLNSTEAALLFITKKKQAVAPRYFWIFNQQWQSAREEFFALYVEMKIYYFVVGGVRGVFWLDLNRGDRDVEVQLGRFRGPQRGMIATR